MAYDGITIRALTQELKTELTGARLYKIAQPEPDELILTFKTPSGQKRVLISASASLPLLHMTEQNKPSPITAPNFCMLLRKHIQNGRLTDIFQPSLERCIHFEFQHLDEMGDLKSKSLIVELMGKHSNIIFCEENDQIIDSIKHISSAVSSVREVLPGRTYFLPDTMEKSDPFSLDETSFRALLSEKPMPVGKAVYSSITGISPVIAQELCYRSGIDSDLPAGALSEDEILHLYLCFENLMMDIRENAFTPESYLENGVPREFSPISLSIFDNLESLSYPTISTMVESYYHQKASTARIRQKSSDLRHIVQTAVERCRRKYDLQIRQLKDTEKREKYRIYGELINTYGYSVPEGSSSMEAFNYYTNENMTIPLDRTITPLENAQKYFDRYSKLKRTFEALTIQTEESARELQYLESVAVSLEVAENERDLAEIREELKISGYIRFRSGDRKSQVKGKPLHFISSDGYDMYVGKNNFQNEVITHKLASGSDWWFHSKKYPGSHVVVKARGTELPDRTFEEAARLAAHYSKGNYDRENKSSGGLVEIDYVQKKFLKKTPGGPLGYVIYHTNYSMTVPTDIFGIKQAED